MRNGKSVFSSRSPSDNIATVENRVIIFAIDRRDFQVSDLVLVLEMFEVLKAHIVGGCRQRG
jgi:hypothetical protein